MPGSSCCAVCSKSIPSNTWEFCEECNAVMLDMTTTSGPTITTAPVTPKSKANTKPLPPIVSPPDVGTQSQSRTASDQRSKRCPGCDGAVAGNDSTFCRACNDAMLEIATTRPGIDTASSDDNAKHTFSTKTEPQSTKNPYAKQTSSRSGADVKPSHESGTETKLCPVCGASISSKDDFCSICIQAMTEIATSPCSLDDDKTPIIVKPSCPSCGDCTWAGGQLCFQCKNTKRAEPSNLQDNQSHGSPPVDVRKQNPRSQSAAVISQSQPRNIGTEDFKEQQVNGVQCVDCGAPTGASWKMLCWSCWAKSPLAQQRHSATNNTGVCVSCGKTTDESWHRWCHGCFATKGASAARNAGECRDCGTRTGESWKQFCNSCYATKQQQQRPSNSDLDATKRRINFEEENHQHQRPRHKDTTYVVL